MNPVKKMNLFILKSYDENDYFTYHRARLFSYLLLFFFAVLMVMSVASLFYGRERFLIMARLTFPAMACTLLFLYILFRGRLEFSVNFAGFVFCFFSVAGFFAKPIYLAGVSLAYFMFVDLVFATLFCSAWVSVTILIFMVGCHFIYFFVKAKPQATGILIELTRTCLVDGVATIILVFLFSFLSTRILKKAIERSNQQTEEMRDQYKSIVELNEAVQGASSDLAKSIEGTSGVIDQFSENTQGQAATMEELAAIAEEMSSNSESVAAATHAQNRSLHDLIAGFEKMAFQIDELETNGNHIAEMFTSLMKLAHEGEESTVQLGDITKKISDNSTEIISVISIMDDFFNRINLLALNATIEAARAGEQGRGFAVVAEEIGKMADSSAGELKLITTLLQTNRNDVESGSEIITRIIGFIKVLLQSIAEIQRKEAVALETIKNQDSLKSIMIQMAAEVKEKAESIEVVMNEQKMSIQNVTRSISATNDIVQKNAEGTELLGRSAKEITLLADNLRSKFRG